MIAKLVEIFREIRAIAHCVNLSVQRQQRPSNKINRVSVNNIWFATGVANPSMHGWLYSPLLLLSVGEPVLQSCFGVGPSHVDTVQSRVEAVVYIDGVSADGWHVLFVDPGRGLDWDYQVLEWLHDLTLDTLGRCVIAIFAKDKPAPCVFRRSVPLDLLACLVLIQDWGEGRTKVSLPLLVPQPNSVHIRTLQVAYVLCKLGPRFALPLVLGRVWAEKLLPKDSPYCGEPSS